MQLNLQASSIPTLADTGEAHGVKATFVRKAQLLAADLHARFGASEPLFAFEDIASCCADSGAIAIAQLRQLGCIDCSKECSSTIASNTELPSGAQERTLRAAAVVAGGKLAEAVGVQPWQLARWMQHQVDAGKVVDLQVHRTVQTQAY